MEPQHHCGQCVYATNRKDSLNRHMLLVHLKGRINQCPTCWRSYKQKGHLSRHRRYECGVDPQFSCSLCTKKFRHKSTLKSHYAFCYSRKLIGTK
nr:unnamed protein product [Callosobruchus analis]